MKKKMYLGIVTLILLLSCSIFTLRYVQSEIGQTAIAKSEQLIESESYYDAFMALTPLLTSDQKSEAQEEALWIAHVITLNWEQSITDEQIPIINNFGADFDNIEINFGYRCGFLQQLINLYPNTERRPIAEYYLIQKNYPAPICVPGGGDVLEKLYAYVDKYEKTGRFEVYMAYLDIAHYHHGLWAVLTYPDEPSAGGRMGEGYASEDPEQDKKHAAEYKAEAMKYYQKYHFNPHGLPVDDSYERLKKNEAFGWYFIVWGC